ncbi:DUF4369 domain-containing protein [Flavobacteriaceae bacterium MHTCC 0001]
MKKTLLALLVILNISCSEKSSDLTVKTNIKGLKKGTVYLKKVIDTTLVTVDSVIVNGESEIILQSALNKTELFYLVLDKNSKEDEAITFFADKGITEINTSVKYFTAKAEIKGSEAQKRFEDYKKLKSRWNNKNLELFKASFEAQKAGDTNAFKAVQAKQNSLTKSRYLQTVNFAVNNNNSVVAPYLALTEVYDINLKYLDTIYTVLTPEIKSSKYGKELKNFLEERKANETSKP